MEKETKHTPEEELIEKYKQGYRDGWDGVISEMKCEQPLKDFCDRLESMHRESSAKVITLQTELSEMKKEREELVGVLNNLVEANPGDSTWNYPAAFDAAISLLNRINKTTNG